MLLLFLPHSLISKYQKMLDQTVRIFYIMKIPNKQGLQKIAFNNFSDVGFEDFMNL